MGQDYFDYLNSAEDSVIKAACQLGTIGGGEDAEFQESAADVLNSLGARLGLVGGFRPPRAFSIFISHGRNDTGMSAVMDIVRGCLDRFEKTAPLPDLRGSADRRPSA